MQSWFLLTCDEAPTEVLAGSSVVDFTDESDVLVTAGSAKAM